MREGWFFIAVVIGLFLLAMYGCAGQTFAGLCLIPAQGQTDGGVPVVKVVCQADK